MSKNVIDRLVNFIIDNNIAEAIIYADENDCIVVVEVIPKDRNPPDNMAALIHEFVETKLDNIPTGFSEN